MASRYCISIQSIEGTEKCPEGTYRSYIHRQVEDFSRSSSCQFFKFNYNIQNRNSKLNVVGLSNSKIIWVWIFFGERNL